jgi:hypothetical protein
MPSGGKRPGAGRPRKTTSEVTGLTGENLSGLPLNAEWQRLLVEMIDGGVDAPDAVETMLSTALGNLCSLYGPEKVVKAMLPLVTGMASRISEQPQTAH